MAANEKTETRVRSSLSRASPEIQEFFDAFGRAVTSGDAKAAAAHWEVPAFVMGDTDTRPVAKLEEVEQFFGGAKEQYNKRGIVDTRADILREDWLTDSIVQVSVRWPYIDKDGNERGDEASMYTLRRDATGKLKLVMVVMRGESQPH